MYLWYKHIIIPLTKTEQLSLNETNGNTALCEIKGSNSSKNPKMLPLNYGLLPPLKIKNLIRVHPSWVWRFSHIWLGKHRRAEQKIMVTHFSSLSYSTFVKGLWYVQSIKYSYFVTCYIFFIYRTINTYLNGGLWCEQSMKYRNIVAC